MPLLQVSRLAMLTLLAVFKDIIPGYRLRLPNAAELAVKVTKEVQKVRDQEAALLRGYQAYLKLLLLQASTGSGNGSGGGGKQAGARMPVQHARVAVRCMCTLLTTLTHFNYT